MLRFFRETFFGPALAERGPLFTFEIFPIKLFHIAEFILGKNILSKFVHFSKPRVASSNIKKDNVPGKFSANIFMKRRNKKFRVCTRRKKVKLVGNEDA